MCPQLPWMIIERVTSIFKENKIKIEKGKRIPPGYPKTNLKIPGFFHRLNPGILYPGIFQESKSRDFLVLGPGYPVHLPTPLIRDRRDTV